MNDPLGYINALIDAALEAAERDRKIRKSIRDRARREGRDYVTQTLITVREAVAAELRSEGWLIPDRDDITTWQPPAGADYPNN